MQSLPHDGGYDTTVTTAQIIRSDSTWTVQVNQERLIGRCSSSTVIINLLSRAVIGGQTVTSDTLNIIKKVNHNPYAQIDITQNGSSLTINGANSSDPDGQLLTYLWKEDAGNPEVLGLNGQTNSQVMVTKPTLPGEYYLFFIC
ncbi:MAG: hypothetical protein MZV64_66550 [Ignavibacteriales bacterium]|nr:hypothetical protein [Ignavibacteriales bacterium]